MQGTGPNMNAQAPGPMGGGNQLPCSNTPTSQTPPQQQGLMMSQTNTIAMGGGQITQNVVNSNNQPGGGMGVLNQAVPGGAMQPRLRMPVISLNTLFDLITTVEILNPGQSQIIYIANISFVTTSVLTTNPIYLQLRPKK